MANSKEEDVDKLYESHVCDVKAYLSWSLSNLNKYKNELIDVGFVVYLELFIKLFKLSVKHGRNFLNEFKNIFLNKYRNYIKRLLSYKFVEQLDELYLINIGYNKSEKYIIVITRNSKRILVNWLNIYNNNMANVIVLEKIDFIDSEMFNHPSVNLFKRYFISKFNIDPENILRFYNEPFLGLIIKDNNYIVDNSSGLNLNLYPEGYGKLYSSAGIAYGLPYDLLYASSEGSNAVGEPSEGKSELENKAESLSVNLNGEICKLEDYGNLVPLPKIGTLLNDTMRSLYYIQANNRILPSSELPGQSKANSGLVEDRENALIYALNYVVNNNNQLNACTLSENDGRFVAVGQNNGLVLFYDLLQSECNNVYNDISCVIGNSIALKSVQSSYSGFRQGLSHSSNTYTLNSTQLTNSVNNVKPDHKVDIDDSVDSVDNGDGDEKADEFGEGVEGNIVCAHDGSVNALKFGESGQVLLTGGNDGLIKLYTTNNTLCKSIYYNTSMVNSENVDPDLSSVGSLLCLDYSVFGYYFASCDVLGYAKLWCTDRSYAVRTFKKIDSNFEFSHFHPNSSLLSALSDNNHFTLYDLRTNKLLLSFNYTARDKSKTKWCKNGIIYGISNVNELLLYDIRNGKMFERVVHENPIIDFDFSYNTNLASVLDSNSIVSVWSFNDMNKYLMNQESTDGKEDQERKKLLKVFKYTNSKLMTTHFTPENLLLTLGTSTL